MFFWDCFVLNWNLAYDLVQMAARPVWWGFVQVYITTKLYAWMKAI